MYTCVVCGSTQPATAWRCSCGGPLEFTQQPEPTIASPPSLNHNAGLWAFEDWLPVERSVSLGEGFTPLVAAPDRDVTYKLEWLFPTGSFKDRGATATISHADQLDVNRVVEDSSGNAGKAIATYAAYAGFDAEIFVPADAKPGKVRAIERTGATITKVEGSRQAVTDACTAQLEGGTAEDPSTAWYASHAWNPAFFEGTATFAYEIAAQRDWTAPDAVVTPLGHGTLFLGAYRGFARLSNWGLIDEIPRLYGVQAAGVAPIVEARDGIVAGEGTNSVADGIQITEPVRAQQIQTALDASGGEAVAIDAERTNAEYDRLHRNGLFVEPTCAVAPAAVDLLREAGELDAEDTVVVALTGTDSNR